MLLDNRQVRECLDIANSFLDTSKTILNYQDDYIDVKELLSTHIYPAVVSAALSSELFMKAMFAIEAPGTDIPRGHKLADLFHKLSMQTQKLVREKFEEGEPNSLEVLLEKSTDSFSDWRYAYEKEVESMPIGLIELADTLNCISWQMLEQASR